MNNTIWNSNKNNTNNLKTVSLENFYDICIFLKFKDITMLSKTCKFCCYSLLGTPSDNNNNDNNNNNNNNKNKNNKLIFQNNNFFWQRYYLPIIFMGIYEN